MIELSQVKYFIKNDWKDWKGINESRGMDLFKEFIYFFIRPLLSEYSRRKLSQETLNNFRPTFVLPERGIPYRTRRRWALNLCQVKEATILIQGVGIGKEVLSWARMGPKKIIGVDLVNFSEIWEKIIEYCKEKYSTQIEFKQGSLENLHFIENSSIDVCASEAVYEHCRDLNSVLKESYRVLKASGILYAAYGPLWFSAGGDHFSGRGGLRNSFNHLLLDPGQYSEFINKFSYEDEERQGGRRYIEIDLFSRLATQEYVDLFKKNGFKIDKLILETNHQSLSYKNKFPELFSILINKYGGKCSADDFIIKSNILFCTKG